MIETGEVKAGAGAVVKAKSSTDCVLADYKVVITADKRVFVRGEMRGELIELRPATPHFVPLDETLRLAIEEVTVIWMRVVQ